MVATSPRLDPRLVAFVFAVDDPRAPIAETWRAVCRRAELMQLPQPGYDTVRRLVHTRRRRRREVDRLLAPVLSDLLAGRVAAWDVERALEAAAIAREGRVRTG